MRSETWNAGKPSYNCTAVKPALLASFVQPVYVRSYVHGRCMYVYVRSIMYVCVICKDSAAPAHAHTRAHRPAAPHQSSGVSQTPHPMACSQAGIPHRPPYVALVCVESYSYNNYTFRVPPSCIVTCRRDAAGTSSFLTCFCPTGVGRTRFMSAVG